MSGLDPIGRKEIRDLIVRLQSEGKTVFMNTHILSDVEMLCHRVAIIVKGEVRYEGDPHAVLGDDERDAEIVLNGVSPAFWESLETRFESGVRGVGDRIAVLLPHKLWTTCSGALAAGAHVVSVTPRRASLEDLFMTTVEQGARR
jgi:ABC-2 type transport system ATP-binding protein